MLTRWPLRIGAAIVGIAVLGLMFAFATEHRAPRSVSSGQAGHATKPAGLVKLPRTQSSASALTRPEQLAIARGLGAHQSAYWVTHSHGVLTATNRGQHVTATFTAPGARLVGKGGSVTLSLRSFGHASAPAPIGAARPQAIANRVTYNYGNVTQWLANGSLGLEQGLTITHAPATGSGPLTAAFGISGSLHPQLSHGSIEFLNAAGTDVLRYGGLSATDAHGHALRSWLTVNGGQLTIHVDATGAAYPITVDPLVQAGQLVASDGATADQLGQSASIAVSGNTIAVGSVNAAGQNGAVYVFTMPAGGWSSPTNEVAELTASDGMQSDLFGQSVAISSDGSTIAVGAEAQDAIAANDAAGVVYVYTQPAGGWVSATETARLTQDPNTTYAASSGLGYAVAMSGTTIFASAPFVNGEAGEVDFFTKPAGGWASGVATGVLTTTQGGATVIGTSLAASANTLVVGNAFQGSGVGDVDVYTMPSGGWATATQTPSSRSRDRRRRPRRATSSGQASPSPARPSPSVRRASPLWQEFRRGRRL